MKKTNFLMLIVALLMGVSFTSCLDSESDPYSYGRGFGKVYSQLGTPVFKIGDLSVYLSAASLAECSSKNIDFAKYTGKMVYISYRWDPTLTAVNEETKVLSDVDLMSLYDLDNTVEIVEERGVSSNDSVNTAPIISLGATQSSDTKPVFYDATTLFLPVNYFMYSKMHYLTLKYYPNEDTDSNTLRLYLDHNAVGEDQNQMTSYEFATRGGYYSFFFKSYRLENVFYRYRQVHGLAENPTTVELVTKENTYSVKLDDTSTKEKVYTITYTQEAN